MDMLAPEFPVLSVVDEGLKFVHVPPAELHLHWQWILKGLEEVKKRVYGRITYTPMHIRQSILQGQAYLYICTDEGVPAVFTVLTIQNDPFLLVPTVLHVWVMYAEKNQNKAVKFAAAEICRLARSLCLERLHFLSPRGNEKVWRRVFGIKGQATMTSFEVNLFEEGA